MSRGLFGWGVVAFMPIVAGAMAHRHMLGIRQLHVQAEHGGIHRVAGKKQQQQCHEKTLHAED